MEIIIGIIVWGIIWGAATSIVIKNKNYNDSETWFWWGFLFGFIALLVAIAKPEYRSHTTYSNQPSHLTPYLQNTNNYQSNSPTNSWYCSKCGKTNYAYVGTCACGNTKRAITTKSNTSAKVTTTTKTTSTNNSAEDLLMYKKLLDAGAITQEEYDAKKKQLLGL